MNDLIENQKREMVHLKIFENVEINFKYSIMCNPKIKPEIDKIYKRTLRNKAKFLLGFYHLNFIKGVEEIIQSQKTASNLIDALLDYISVLFDNIELNLRIKNHHDLERLNMILQISIISMDNAVKYNDVELAFESFYQIENRLELENLFSNSSQVSYKLEFLDNNIIDI